MVDNLKCIGCSTSSKYFVSKFFTGKHEYFRREKYYTKIVTYNYILIEVFRVYILLYWLSLINDTDYENNLVQPEMSVDVCRVINFGFLQ